MADQAPNALGHFIRGYPNLFSGHMPSIFQSQGGSPKLGSHRPGPHHAYMNMRTGQFAVERRCEVIQEGFGGPVKRNALAGQAARFVFQKCE